MVFARGKIRWRKAHSNGTSASVLLEPKRRLLLCYFLQENQTALLSLSSVIHSSSTHFAFFMSIAPMFLAFSEINRSKRTRQNRCDHVAEADRRFCFAFPFSFWWLLSVGLYDQSFKLIFQGRVLAFFGSFVLMLSLDGDGIKYHDKPV